MPTGQQRNSLQGENDDASEEAEGVLQPETGTVDGVDVGGSVQVTARLSMVRLSKAAVVLCFFWGGSGCGGEHAKVSV